MDEASACQGEGSIERLERDARDRSSGEWPFDAAILVGDHVLSR